MILPGIHLLIMIQARQRWIVDDLEKSKNRPLRSPTGNSQKPRGRRNNKKEGKLLLASSVPAYGPVEQRALVEPPAAVHRREELQLPQRRRDEVRADGHSLLRRRPPRRLLPVHLLHPSPPAESITTRSTAGWVIARPWSWRTNGFLTYFRRPERLIGGVLDGDGLCAVGPSPLTFRVLDPSRLDFFFFEISPLDFILYLSRIYVVESSRL